MNDFDAIVNGIDFGLPTTPVMPEGATVKTREDGLTYIGNLARVGGIEALYEYRVGGKHVLTVAAVTGEERDLPAHVAQVIPGNPTGVHLIIRTPDGARSLDVAQPGVVRTFTSGARHLDSRLLQATALVSAAGWLVELYAIGS